MTAPRTLLLDNEAIQALRDPTHPKHRRALSHVEANLTRRSRGERQRIIVPTSVRVEAGWSRTSRGPVTLPRLGVIDVVLDTATANVAAEILERTGVSVADAHLGAVARGIDGEIVILTSDPNDMRLVSQPKPVTAIRI